MAEHRITRVRRETRRRRLTVASVEPLGNAMLRIWLVGDELAGFESAAPDDHVKLFLADGSGGTAARDYTPRHFDAATRTLAIDFALHGDDAQVGPATRWAMTAAAGDEIEVGGPRGSAIVPDDFDWYLLVGDETAIPAIGRRLEELRPDVPVLVVVSVAPGVVLPPLVDRPDRSLYRVERHGGDDGAELVAAVVALTLPEGDGFVWIAAEAAAARRARDAMLARGHPREWLKASGYWLAGAAGAHTKLGE